MGMRQRDVPVTRDDVASWLTTYVGPIKKSKKMKDFLELKLGGNANIQVDTSEHHSLKDTTPLILMILEDIESYA